MTRVNEAKTLVKHTSYNFKIKFNTKAYSNQKQNNETCQCECENYRTCEEDYSWNPSTSICENGKYSKSVADDSKIVHDETINATDSVSINITNAIPTNVTKTISTNVTNIISANVMSTL